MKKNFTITLTLTAVIICGFMINSIFASGAAPGSANDPLVSKSYVDDKVNQLMSLINLLSTTGSISGNMPMEPVIPSEGTDTMEIVNKVITQIEYLYGLAPGTAPVGTEYEAVFAFAGQYIIGYEGTEIILRSGRAAAYCLGENGLSNITKGIEIYGGAEVETNNMLIISRSDGRGVRATTDAWFLIRGRHDVLNL